MQEGAKQLDMFGPAVWWPTNLSQQRATALIWLGPTVAWEIQIQIGNPHVELLSEMSRIEKQDYMDYYAAKFGYPF